MSALLPTLTAKARAALKEFLPPIEEVLHLQRAGGGFSEAIVIEVRTTIAGYALRLSPSRDEELKRVEERHRWLRHLFQNGLPVAVPLPVRSSPHTLWEDSGSYWQLEPWLPGLAASPCEMNSPRWRSVMQTLARLHAASAQYRSSPAGRQWFNVEIGRVPAIVERRRILADWTPERIREAGQKLGAAPEPFRTSAFAVLGRFLKFASRIDEELQECESIRVPLFPCFRDLWQAHVLFSGNEVTGLIDPAAAKTDHPATDLSRLLGSLLEDDWLGWESALKFYDSVRPLSADDRQLIRTLDRSSVLLSGMTWVRRWCDGLAPWSGLDEVTFRLETFARRLQHF